MNVFDKHQIKIAKHTLKMSDIGASFMGGMTKLEAIEILRKKMSEKELKSLLLGYGYSPAEINDLYSD